MLESALTKKIKKALQEEYPRDKWTKIHGDGFQEAGISDLIGCHRGKFIAIEVKRPGKDYREPTPRQKKYLADVKASGGFSSVITSVKEALDFVKSIK